MKKSYIKSISIITLLIFITLTAGCNVSNDSAEAQLKELGSTNAKNLKEVTLTFYFPGTELGDTKKVLSEIEKKSKKSINAKLNFKFVPQTGFEPYDTVMLRKLASNESIDAFYCYGPSISSDFNPVILDKEGKLKDVSKLFPQYAPNLYKKYSNDELSSGTIDGKLLAVPNLNPQANFNYAIIREDLRVKYNIPEIKNYGDYEFFLKTIREKEKEISPVDFDRDGINMFANENGYAVLDGGMGLFYKWDDPAMKIIPFERTPEFSNFIGMISRWYSNGYFLENGVSSSTNESEREQMAMEMLCLGKAASFIGNAGTVDILNDLKKTRPKAVNYDFKGYLLAPGNNVQRVNPIDACIVFSKKSKNVERALMFMEWVQESQENYDLLMYGIKGEHYNTDKVECPKGIYTDRSQYYLGWPGQKVFENLKFTRFIGPSSYFTDQEKKSYDNAILNDSKYAPHTGFYPDYSSLETESSVRGNFLNQLISGMISKQDIDQDARKQFDDSTDKIVKSIQNQLDNWRNKKNK